jgi:anti-anti-sigma regulatory factor
MALRYILMEFGTSFATRGRGRDLREDLEAKASPGGVVIDFAGVTNVSYSFADEFVGKLGAGGVDLTVENMSPPVERSVLRAMTRRAGAPAGC